MLNLTKEQKSDLEDLKKRPGFKVLISIIEDMELSTFRLFKNIDYNNPIQLEILKKNTYYVRGMEDVLKTLNTGTNQISERKSDEQLEKEIKEKQEKEQE